MAPKRGGRAKERGGRGAGRAPTKKAAKDDNSEPSAEIKALRIAPEVSLLSGATIRVYVRPVRVCFVWGADEPILGSWISLVWVWVWWVSTAGRRAGESSLRAETRQAEVVHRLDQKGA